MNFMKTFLAALLAVVAGSLLTFLFWIVVLMGVAGSFEKSVTVTPGSVLKIDFSEVITDAPSNDPLAGIDLVTLQSTPHLSLMQALRSIETAATDDRIQGICLRMNGVGGPTGMAILEELRAAIVEFKQSGKFVVSYNETYTQGQYYLATAADKIFLQPEGAMDWSGLSMNMTFYKGLFDKLDLKTEVFRPTACKYKSAVEPYISTKMSDANREQMQTLVNSLWHTLSGEVGRARGIDSAAMQKLTDNLSVTLPEEALERGFVDGLIYEDQLADAITQLDATPDNDGRYTYITLGDYAAQVGADLKNISANQIALVYADGAIVDGEGVGREIYGNTLAAMLRDVRFDEKVKAVVLRVNSPGGSALASDVIWREMELLRAEKPVIVSMGSYAASGGYYISAPADAIVADKFTLTGSIGVFGMYIYTPDALKNKLGITLDGVKSNTSAGMGQISPLTAAERAVVMRGVDKVYTTFTNLVASGRNLPIEKVLNIAEGRVWSGTDALQIGLVDTCGGLKTAIAVAADKAGLGDAFRVHEVVEAPTGFAAFVSSLNVRLRAAFDRSELGGMMAEYDKVREMTSRQGILMYHPLSVEIR